MGDSSSNVPTTPVAFGVLRTFGGFDLATNDRRHKLSEYRAKICDEMSHTPVLIDDNVLLNHILALPANIPLLRKPARRASPFDELVKADEMKEKNISALMESAMNKKRLAPGLKFHLCENQPDPSSIDEDGQKIDAALFYEKDAPKDARPNWADQLVSIEFKRGDDSLDPFDDAMPQLRTNAESKKKVRGQIISYAELVFNIQQRTFLIMLLVMGTKVRVMRWDRSGVATSRAINYINDWELFCDILFRISVLAAHAPHRLGLDSSATRIHPGDALWKVMDDVAQRRDSDVDAEERGLRDDEATGPFTFDYIRTLFRGSLKDNWPRFELQVPGQNAHDDSRRFLVGRPYYQQKGLIGRGTRGYAAYDLTTRRFTWLKDAWRTDYDGVEKEGDTLAKLNQANVQNVPTLVCHGDILNHVTETPDFCDTRLLKFSVPDSPFIPRRAAASSSGPSSGSQGNKGASGKRKRGDDKAKASTTATDSQHRRHKHYRLVVEEVCMSIESFVDGAMLLSIVYDCIGAHYGAWKLLHILHRDVSGGNVLIYPKIVESNNGRRIVWKGLLADWELAKDTRVKIKRQPERTGTWQFMSVALLAQNDKVVELSDDLESFFHVILYYGVRYLQSNVSDVPDFIESFFDAYSFKDGKYGVGRTKSTAMKTSEGLTISPDPASAQVHFASPLDGLLFTLRGIFHSYYKIQHYEARKALLPIIPPSPDTDEDAPSTPTRSSGVRFVEDFFYVVQQKLEEHEENDLRQQTADDEVPTAEDRKRAPYVAKHEYILLLLRKHIQRPWPRIKNNGDLIPANWESTRAFGPTASPGNGKSNKKHKPPAHSMQGVLDEDARLIAADSKKRARRGRNPREIPAEGLRRSARLAKKA